MTKIFNAKSPSKDWQKTFGKRSFAPKVKELSEDEVRFVNMLKCVSKELSSWAERRLQHGADIQRIKTDISNRTMAFSAFEMGD